MWQLFSEPIGSHKTLNTYLLTPPLPKSVPNHGLMMNVEKLFGHVIMQAEHTNVILQLKTE